MGKFAAFKGADMDLPAERSPTKDEMGALLVRIGASPQSALGIVASLADAVRALRGCAWLDGEPGMELTSEPGGVTVQLYAEQGAVRERVLPPMTIPLPLDELDVAAQGAPELFAPLRMQHHEGKLVFTLTGIAPVRPPPQVATESLLSRDPNPHEKPTVKQPPYIMPDALRSGTHARSDPEQEG
jgi:hypothetical protein